MLDEDLFRCDCMFVTSEGFVEDQCIKQATQDDGLCDNCREHHDMSSFTRRSLQTSPDPREVTAGAAD